ncbi:MAG: hypothetical protein ACRDS9_24695, partial [Pseudonocardiaceae bacterium]
MTRAPDTPRGAHAAGRVGGDPAGRDVSADGPDAPLAHGPRHRTVVLAGLAGLVAVVAALLMPFAPVSVNEPTVS